MSLGIALSVARLSEVFLPLARAIAEVDTETRSRRMQHLA